MVYVIDSSLSSWYLCLQWRCRYYVVTASKVCAHCSSL